VAATGGTAGGTAAGREGGSAKGNNSVFCGYVRAHLGTAIKWGLDNRDDSA